MKKLLSLLLSLALLLSFVACENNDKNPPATTEAQADAAPVTFVPSNRYNIFRGEFYRNCDEILKATSALQSAFREAYGISCSAFASLSEKDPSKIYEILVGDTGRPESTELMAGLGTADFAWRIVSEHLIVIAGGSAAATEEAVEHFCQSQLAAEKTPLTVGASHISRAAYEYDDVLLNGISFSDVTIAVKGSADLSAAQVLIRDLGSYAGKQPNLIPVENLTGSEKGLIVLGAAATDGSTSFGSGYAAYHVDATVSADGFTVFLDSNDPSMSRNGMRALLESVKRTTEGKICKVTLEDLSLRALDFGNSIPAWSLTNVKTEQIADGVTYSDRTYKDEKGLPYRAHVLEIDPSKAYFYMGSSYDNYELTPSKTESVNGQMSSAIANGLAVVGGVNADFFDLGGTNAPRGLTIKEGKLLSVGESTRAYIGFTYDGRIVFDSSPYSYTNYNLRTAVGGSHIILKNGAPFDIGGTDSFATTSHPRTLAGVREDGTVLLVVVDGRQEKISNGAPLARCAALMAELGAVDAINLDGGGPSTLSVTQNGKVVTKNDVSSGGTLRKVYNSLLVVSKPAA